MIYYLFYQLFTYYAYIIIIPDHIVYIFYYTKEG